MNSTKIKLPNRLEKNIVSATKLFRLVDSSHIGIVVPYNCRSPDSYGAPLIIHLDTAPNPCVATGCQNVLFSHDASSTVLSSRIDEDNGLPRPSLF